MWRNAATEKSRLRKATEERIMIRIESRSGTTRVLDRSER
jgi:hypothetical protein